MEPNQKNAPLEDDLVVALEEAGREVVEEKIGVRRDMANITKSVLSGGTDDHWSVTVKVDRFIMNVDRPVLTDLGPGRVKTVYPPDEEGIVVVSVEFEKGTAIPLWEDA